MNVFTFEQWQENYINTTPGDTILDCPMCDGEGVISEACTCCLHTYEEDCATCEGSGKVPFGELSKTGLNKLLSRKNYQQYVEKDIKDYANWIGINHIQVFVDLGYTVYSSIYNKVEFVTKAEA